MAPKWWLVVFLPALALAAGEAGSVAEELLADDECRADAAGAEAAAGRPACALSALQLRRGASEAAAAEAREAPAEAPVAPEAVEEAAEADEDSDDEDAAGERVGNEAAILAHLFEERFEEEAETADCPKDTGGTCRFMTCDASRNAFCKKSSCHTNWIGGTSCHYKCLCPAGYCAKGSACFKAHPDEFDASSAGAGAAAGAGAVTSQEISQVKSQFGLSDQSAQQCAKQFASTDQGSKGFITAADLVADVQRRGKQATEAQMQTFIDHYDLNKDGKLSFVEFGYMWSQTQKQR